MEEIDLQAARKRLDELVDGMWAFSALASLCESGVLSSLVTERTPLDIALEAGVTEALARALLDVLVSVELASKNEDHYIASPILQTLIEQFEMDDMNAWLRNHRLQSSHMVDAARHRTLTSGWSHVDPDILHAQGVSGRDGTRRLVAEVFPKLPGLEARLRSTEAAFLDAGLGVGTVSIELCHSYPRLQVIGLEPGMAQMIEARSNVAKAGLQGRINVLPYRVEDIDFEEAFDLAYLPQVFMPLDVVRAGLGALWRALRPGGWLITVALAAPGYDLSASTARLINVLWGGSPVTADELAEMARAAGFESVHDDGVPDGAIRGIVGRRPFY